jgi:TRAP-type C4-dicarboxylate transport system permease large subunit
MKPGQVQQRVLDPSLVDEVVIVNLDIHGGSSPVSINIYVHCRLFRVELVDTLRESRLSTIETDTELLLVMRSHQSLLHVLPIL